MNLRFISPTFHGIIDYLAAIALITSPFILGLGASSSMAKWISVVSGIVVVVLSTNTIYRFGIFNTIPFDTHLFVDLTVATAFAISPLILNFRGIDLSYYVISSVAVFLVVALSDNRTPKFKNFYLTSN